MEGRSDRLFIPQDWKHWVAENLLRGAPAAELAEILVREGFPADLSRLEVDAAAQHPYVLAGQSLARQVRKRDWFFHTQRLLESESQSEAVERRQAVSGDEFRDRYYALNRPVILTDVVCHWPAVTRWDADYLRECCGQITVQIQNRRESDAQYEILKDAHRDQCRFGEYVDRVFLGGESNDCYMTASNATSNRAVLQALWDDITMPDAYADASRATDQTFLWFGPAGTITPLHHDLTNNFMAQVRGRKRIRLISPAHFPLVYNHRHCFSQVDLNNVDLKRFPEFRDVRIHDVILNPGELLFLPVGWWHHVVALDVSITLTFTNCLGRNDFTEFYHTYSEI